MQARSFLPRALYLGTVIGFNVHGLVCPSIAELASLALLALLLPGRARQWGGSGNQKHAGTFTAQNQVGHHGSHIAQQLFQGQCNYNTTSKWTHACACAQKKSICPITTKNSRALHDKVSAYIDMCSKILQVERAHPAGANAAA